MQRAKKDYEFAQYSQIFLKTDKPVYQAGETLSGKISLNLLQTFPGGDVRIKLKGRETVHIVKKIHNPDLCGILCAFTPDNDIDPYNTEEKEFREMVKAY